MIAALESFGRGSTGAEVGRRPPAVWPRRGGAARRGAAGWAQSCGAAAMGVWRRTWVLRRGGWRGCGRGVGGAGAGWLGGSSKSNGPGRGWDGHCVGWSEARRKSGWGAGVVVQGFTLLGVRKQRVVGCASAPRRRSGASLSPAVRGLAGLRSAHCGLCVGGRLCVRAFERL